MLQSSRIRVNQLPYIAGALQTDKVLHGLLRQHHLELQSAGHLLLQEVVVFPDLQKKTRQ